MWAMKDLLPEYEMVEDFQHTIIETNNSTDRIEIEYFTDPLCCWSWAFEPHWRRFLHEYKHLIKWKYRMGVMIEDWTRYTDPLNDVSRPAQMGPLWMQVKHMTGAEIDSLIWMEDPPQSSFPACMAVKCAELQSPAAADLLLTILRRAVMTQKRNISKKEVILEIAAEASKYKLMDIEKFKVDFAGNKGIAGLREDLQKVKYNAIGRFPTITMLVNNGKGLMIVGYRPYEVMAEAFEELGKKSSRMKDEG
jgi:putative protein-disulfide isomerase